jgi:chaperone required for assembly of F1-ATPase
MKRFYQDVTVRAEGEGFAVYLGAKRLQTPRSTPIVLPNHALAEAVAQEWRGQGETLDFASMLLTKLANTAVDLPAIGRLLFVTQIFAFAKNDVVCYRADDPISLVERQRATWDSILDWLEARHGARLRTVTGFMHAEQSRDDLEKLLRHLTELDNFTLAGLHSAATITSSLVIALALVDGHLDAAQAFAAATVDESHQAEYWGRDEEAEARRQRLLAELTATERFLKLSKA